MALLILGGIIGQTAQANVSTKLFELRFIYPQHHHVHHLKKNVWLVSWQRKDQSIYPAIHEAALIFNVSETLLRTINSREGGNVDPVTLHNSLCSGGGTGWNDGGSDAFGAMQFMLENHAPCDTQTEWGTFGSYDDAAFQYAKAHGIPVPYRFKNPASNVGQAITAAYMILTGHLSAWNASMG